MTQLFLVLRLNGWIVTKLVAFCFSYPDIVVYLLHTTSSATLDEVKNYLPDTPSTPHRAPIH